MTALPHHKKDEPSGVIDPRKMSNSPQAVHTREFFGIIPLAGALVAGVLLLPWLIRLSPLQATLCFIQTGISAAGIARAAYPALRPVALVTFVFNFSWLGVAPTYQLATGTAAWRDSAVLLSSSTTSALLLVVLATATLYVGFFRPNPSRPQVRALQTTAIVPRRAICLGYVLACCALAPKAIAAAGGLAAMFSTRADRSEAFATRGISLQEAGGLQLALVGILPGALATAGAFLVLIRVMRQYDQGRWTGIKTADAILLLAAFLLVVVFANPFVNTRALSAAAIGSLALLITRPRSSPAGIATALLLLTATLVAYPAANAFRGTEQAEGSQGFEFLASPDFDGFQQTINAIDFVDDLGHSFGTYGLSGALYFVPRAIWPDKERPASIDVATHRGYVFTNLSLPVQAEIYVDFGAAGMTVAMFLLATAGRRCDLDWASGSPSRMALLAPYASLACLSIIRGPIGANGPVYLTNLGLIAIGLLLAYKTTVNTSITKTANQHVAQRGHKCKTDDERDL
ncbi:hypothetical protein ACU610_21760 [Geodermatophilus sp. URMC 61]|uniref:hypothetical protein n=1 Tax=Geodermatophilus sp. URMC 61 TaxID=3423411 RepID=UPI00406C506A